jgi:hypothetical protein
MALDSLFESFESFESFECCASAQVRASRSPGPGDRAGFALAL